MKILADGHLPGLIQAFPKPFELSLYEDSKEIPSLLKGHEILLCRSTLKVNENLLRGHSLRYVATASSGTDHIDSLYLKNNGIQLIDAKGCNALAVADYVIATLAYLQKFSGFSGKKAAVIGVGEVGKQVVKRLIAAGLNVYCYDPFRAEVDSHFCHSTLQEIVECDLIAMHANLHDEPPYPSRNFLNELLLNQLKSGTVIINASRGGIVNEEALLQQKKPLIYCTDVFANEPQINPKLIEFATLCTPHIAGHSIEAKYTAIAMISNKLHDCFHLPTPSLNWQTKGPTITSNEKNWQDLILSLYNPVYETNLLKAAEDLEFTFLKLRKAHQNRHNFCCYDFLFLSKKTREILGLASL